MKRVLVAVDFHSGHQVGLTHPDFERKPSTKSKQYKYYRIRREMWDWYANTVASLQPIDVGIFPGDLIDGRGDKNGGIELLLPDRNEQCDCAAANIEETKAEVKLLAYGTPYHCGLIEDYEDLIAKSVSALKIESHGFVDINGVKFDYRHHIGRSSVPHTRFTPIAREKLWAMIWAERGEYPDCDVLLRGHVHYFDYCGSVDWLAVTLPALQAYWTRYGTRYMSGTVDFGLVWFDITDKEHWTWHYKVKRLKSRQDILKV